LTETLKIVIPMAGWGTRMRPHTWSKPKPLVSVAGKPSLDHLMDMFTTMPDAQGVEYIFIISPYLGEQIPPYIAEHYPHIKATFVVQQEMKGQSHALWLARKRLDGPMLICFADTLMETDFSFLAKEEMDGVAWVMPVPDPRRFGVAELNSDGMIKRLIEKPESNENNLALVGCYYFRNSKSLISAIVEQMKHGTPPKGEYFLADAINIMLKHGARMRTNNVKTWLDTGTIEATLDTNIYMLDHGHNNSEEAAKRTGITVVPPVFIHPSAKIVAAVIGPHVSIGPDCEVNNCVIRNTILDEGAEVTDSVLDRSFIGREAKVGGHPTRVNMGDNSDIRL
jgi:glucose-1-phosphate thymidylyltransferase